MSHLVASAPVTGKRFLTPGVWVLLSFMGVGFVFLFLRFFFGIGAVANLTNQFPWGIWIGIDVASGVALAAGGFTTGALAYVFNRRQYHAVIRPALLTAMLGYTFVVLGLMVDIGRYWNIYSPMFNWNGNSVLFEVAICVMLYLNVLYIEFLPIVIERFKGRVKLPGAPAFVNRMAEKILSVAEGILGKVMFVFIIAGIVLSFLHQSSLGSLMLIAPYKVHPLWYTPILPLLFLLSAIAAGYPMVTLESILVAKSLGRRPEMEVLTPLAKSMPIFMGLYLVVKVGDMIVRGTYRYLLDGTTQSNAFLVEILIGVILPFVLVLFKRVRASAGWLLMASTIFVLGILLNRINVFLVSYSPPYILKAYFPALGEIFITMGLIATLMFLYRVFVFIFPVLGAHPVKGTAILVLVTVLAGPFFFPGRVFSEEVIDYNAKKTKKIVAGVRPTDTVAPKERSLNHPMINRYSDLFEPVPFKHSKHLKAIKNQDCTICHHRQPRDKGDRYGEPVKMRDLQRLQKLPVSCSSCHEQPFNPKQIHVPGLKGAYHQLCLDCHQKSEKERMAGRLVLSKDTKKDPYISAEKKRPLNDCLTCHAKKGVAAGNMAQVEKGKKY
ncbi:MAG: NrfD/PsrC family molybdoenzyme membrane anchor subunit [Thermodesulfobacteriota bacterium]